MLSESDTNELRGDFDNVRKELYGSSDKVLQKLNELKRWSMVGKFPDLLKLIQETEKEADRAARDILNLYEQFYTKRMRREDFDRLLPSYRRRLERSLDQFSDQLKDAEKEAKLTDERSTRENLKGLATLFDDGRPRAAKVGEAVEDFVSNVKDLTGVDAQPQETAKSGSSPSQPVGRPRYRVGELVVSDGVVMKVSRIRSEGGNWVYDFV